MKSIRFLGMLILATVLGLGMQAFGLKTEVPQKVKDGFAIKFPEVKKVKWDKESDNEWEAEFKMKGTAYSANFLEDGTWQETEYEIKKRAIPSNLKLRLTTSFPTYAIIEAEISETLNGLVYEFNLKDGRKKLDVVMDINGNVIK